MLRKFTPAICAVLVHLLASNAFGQNKMDPLRQRNTILLLDRIAIAFSKEPASSSDKLEVLEGRMSVADYIDKFQQDPRFEKNFAEFWNEVMGINGPISFEDIYVSKPRYETFSSLARKSQTYNLSGHHFSNPPHVPYYANHPEAWVVRLNMGQNPQFSTPKDDLVEMDYDGDGQTEFWHNALYDCGCHHGKFTDDISNKPPRENPCPDTVRIRTDESGMPLLGKYAEYGGVGFVQTTTDLSDPNVIVARNDNVKLIRPWWDPSIEVRACKLLDHENYCGPNLEKCWIGDDGLAVYSPQNMTYFSNLSYGLTMEPGMLIARTVSNGNSWKDVLTTTKTVLNESVLSLLHNRHFGHVLVDHFLPKINGKQSFPLREVAPVFANAMPNRLSSFHEVDREVLGAGVMATMAFHRVTNGWRAKANRVREAFLCSTFVAPDSDQIASDIEDLTQRPYCKGCHAILEPLAQTFAQWPNNDNFGFDEKGPADGFFAGYQIHGVEELSQRLVEMPSFSRCAVTRGFEFLTRRPMTTRELTTILPELVAHFEKNNFELWPTLSEIARHPTFMGQPVGGEP